MGASPVKLECIVDAQCKAPTSAGMLTEKPDSVDRVYTRVCGVHARELRGLGFYFAVDSRWVNVTKFVKPETRALANQACFVPPNRWEELALAPRDWCAYGCKIYVKRFGNAVSFQLLHSASYGCLLGEVA
jgi:hypothetical protein